MSSCARLVIPILITRFQPEDVTSLLSIKLASKYAQLRDVESMRAIARAHQKRNLADFEKALKDYQQGLYLFFRCLTLCLMSIAPFQNSLQTRRSEHTFLRCTTPSLNRTFFASSSPTQWSRSSTLRNKSARAGKPSSSSAYSLAVSPHAQGANVRYHYRLSQMILDKVFHGVLDQGRGCLLIFEQPEADVRISPRRAAVP